MKKLFLIILFIIFSSFAFSQVSKVIVFNSDSLVNQIDSYFSKYNKKFAKSISDDYKNLFEKSEELSEEKSTIANTLNLFLNSKLDLNPSIINYLESVLLLLKKSKKQLFFKWSNIIKQQLKYYKTTKNLKKFLTFSKKLFSNQILYELHSEKYKWIISPANYEFYFDSIPYIKVENTDLKCLYENTDSIIIKNTKGVYFPLKNKWHGVGGIIDWRKVNYDENKVFAKITGDYKLKTNSTEINIDSVEFVHTVFFSTPILGSIKDKIIPSKIKKYPKFDTYQKKIKIDDIALNTDYEGGFSIYGNNFIGSGTQENRAALKIYRNDTLFIEAHSLKFNIKLKTLNSKEKIIEKRRIFKKKQKIESKKENIITSSDAEIIMHIGNKQISHTNISFKYFIDRGFINLIKSKEGKSRSPYKDTYHGIEMDVELIEWIIDDPKVYFKTLPSSIKKIAFFTSDKYFNLENFDDLMKFSYKHPLTQIKHCSEKHKSRTLSLYEIADCMDIPPTSIESMIILFSYLGYLNYNSESKKIIVLDKLIHHVLSRSGLIDYDEINIISNGAINSNNIKTNAILDLRTKEFEIFGIKNILINRKHKTGIIPYGNKITLYGNKNFSFSGIIKSGKFDFYTKNSYFNYDSFKIRMPIIDSVELWSISKKKDVKGFFYEQKVLSKLEKLKGELLIDIPKNKSGIVNIPDFPKFKSLKKCYVYYDYINELKGIYKPEKFYFKVDEFVIKGIDKIRNDQYNFKGTLVSNIFPEINNYLKLQTDNSLGFITKTPPTGFPVYKNKGTFTNQIKLSHRGLKGTGKLKYITSVATSEEFSFFPDSVEAITNTLNISHQANSNIYPKIKAEIVKYQWNVTKEHLDIKMIKSSNPIDMYEGQNIMTHGSLKYTPHKLIGKGKHEFSSAFLYSDSILFKKNTYSSEKTKFTIKKNPLEKADLLTDDIQINVDFNKREVHGNSRDKMKKVIFEKMDYVTEVNSFIWYLVTEKLDVTMNKQLANKNDTVFIDKAKFISIDESQDSLNWYAEKATYDINNWNISAQGVDFINIADVQIIPDKGIIQIDKSKKISILKNAKISLNKKTNYHSIYGVYVNINSRNNFEGQNGFYDYENTAARYKKQLNIKKILTNNDSKTIAYGEITKEENFNLNPAFQYYGNFELSGENKFAHFSGYVKLKHNCKNLKPDWAETKSFIDPQDVKISILNSKSPNRNAISSSLVIPYDELEKNLIGRFLQTKPTIADHDLNPTEGVLIYDSDKKLYKLGEESKFSDIYKNGEYIELNTKTCDLRGTNRFDLTVKKSKLVNVQTIGGFEFNSAKKDNNNLFEFTILLNFLFSKNALNLLTDMIINTNEELKSIDVENPIYQYSIRELIKSSKNAEKFIRDLSIGLNDKLSIPKELNKTFVFSDVKMIWNPEKEFYNSVGPLGIAYINGNSVNRYVDGVLIFRDSRAGYELGLYLEISKKEWFAFKYNSSTGLMRSVSSIPEYNTILTSIKRKNAKTKIKGEKTYIYIKGTNIIKNDILLKLE